MKRQNLRFSISGQNELALGTDLIKKDTPSVPVKQVVMIDGKKTKVGANWLRDSMKRRKQSVVYWELANGDTEIERAFVFSEDAAMNVELHRTPSTETALDSLSEVPFELASFEMIWLDWYTDDIRGTLTPRYTAPGYGDLHYPLGWAAAIKGAGHRQFVSRRWLQHGPWRVIQAPDDMTFIQFHDLTVDSETALEQARPGHHRLANRIHGGFLQTDFIYQHELKGAYLKKEQKLQIVVHGREVTPREMLEACAARLYQPFDYPVKQIAYVFMEERVAREHLHELWLHELECWTIINGQQVRLDVDYSPPIVKPQWVHDVEAREQSRR